MIKANHSIRLSIASITIPLRVHNMMLGNDVVAVLLVLSHIAMRTEMNFPQAIVDWIIQFLGCNVLE